MKKVKCLLFIFLLSLLLMPLTYKNETKSVKKLKYYEENNVIKNIKLKTSINDFRNSFESKNPINFICKSPNKYIGTSCILGSGKINYTVLVLGDVSGDGLSTITDIVNMSDNYYKTIKFEDSVIKEASDIDFNNKYDKNDINLLSNLNIENKDMPSKKPGKGVVKVLEKNISLNNADTYKISPVFKSKDVSLISTKSSNSNVASISSDGVVTGISGGNTTVSLKFSNDEVFDINVDVDVNLTGIKLAGENNLDYIGKTTNLNYELSPINTSYKDVLWETSDKSVLSVNSNGVVTGLKKGKATITVRSKSKPNIFSSLDITVNDNLKASIDDSRYKDYKVLKAGSKASYKLKSSTGYKIKSINALELWTQEKVDVRMVKSNVNITFDEKTQEFSFNVPNDINDIGLLKFKLNGVTDEKGNISKEELSGYQFDFSLNYNTAVNNNEGVITTAVGVDNSFYVKDYTYYIKEKSEKDYKKVLASSLDNAYVYKNLKEGSTYNIKVEVKVYKDRLINIGNGKNVYFSTDSKKYRLDETNDNYVTGTLEDTVTVKKSPKLDIFMLDVSNLNDKFNDELRSSDCMLIMYNGKSILIDAARYSDVDKITKVLSNLKITKLDYLIITHAHPDHSGIKIDENKVKTFPLANKVKIDNLVISRYAYGDYVKPEGTKINVATSGNVINAGGLIFNVLAPYTFRETPYEWFNDDCTGYTECINESSNPTKCLTSKFPYGVCADHVVITQETDPNDSNKKINVYKHTGIRNTITVANDFKAQTGYIKDSWKESTLKDLPSDIKNNDLLTYVHYYRENKNYNYGYSNTSSRTNNFSIISKLMLGNRTLLTTGDAEFYEEEILMGVGKNKSHTVYKGGLYDAYHYDKTVYKPSKWKFSVAESNISLYNDLEKKYGKNIDYDKKYKLYRFPKKDLKSDILKRGHHLYNNTSSFDFLNAVNPTYILIAGHSDPKRVFKPATDITFLDTFSAYGINKYFRNNPNKILNKNVNIKANDEEFENIVLNEQTMSPAHSSKSVSYVEVDEGGNTNSKLKYIRLETYGYDFWKITK